MFELSDIEAYTISPRTGYIPHHNVENINKPNCRFSYAGNWGLVKSIVGTTFRKTHICLHSQVGIRL